MENVCARRFPAWVAAVLLAAGCAPAVDQAELLRAGDSIEPVVTIQRPSDGSAYAPAVTIEGAVLDRARNDGTPGRVELLTFQVEGQTTGGDVPFDADGAFSFTVTTEGLTGTLAISVTAVDWNGNTGRCAVSLLPPREITSFAFLTSRNPSLGQDAVGQIGDASISVIVPITTDRTALVASFDFLGSSVEVGGVGQTSGETANDFRYPVTYRVVANTGDSTSYVVTVDSTDEKEIASFGFLAADNPGLGSDVAGTISGATIDAVVPYGTDVSGLVATFATTGVAVSVGGVEQTSGVTANNFASPVQYLVRAEDGTFRTYAVAVEVALSQAKDISSFGFSAPAVSGTVDDQTGFICAGVARGTEVTALTAIFTTTGGNVSVGGVAQQSGVTANDYSAPVFYTVTAADSSTREYRVFVYWIPSMVAVPGGESFEMGPDTHEAHDVAHTVTAVSGFSLSAFETTYAEWGAVKRWADAAGYLFTNPGRIGSEDGGVDSEQEPVAGVSWYDVLKWCNALSQMQGCVPAYYTDALHTTVYRTGEVDLYEACVLWSGGGYRLPTELEWEYAARYREGSTWTPAGEHSGSDLGAVGECAYYVVNSGLTTHEVGGNTSNALSLYDMSGNIREWCWDCWGYYDDPEWTYTDADFRGPDPNLPVYRILRGGDWGTTAEWVATGARTPDVPAEAGDLGAGKYYYGFRVAGGD